MPDAACGGSHVSSISYSADDGTMGWVHASFFPVCQCCAVRAQIAYIEKLAAALPGLHEELEDTACQEVAGS